MARLSDVKGERTLEVIAEIVEPVINIAADGKAAGLFGRKALPEGLTVKDFIISRIRSALPMLLKNHKEDVITICAAISGMTKEEYAKELTFEKAIFDLADLVTDATFNAFFNSAQSHDTDT